MVIDSVNDQLYASLEEKVVIESGKDKTLTLKGWAVDDKERISGSRVYLVFRKNGEEIIVPSARQSRPDVAKHFKENGYKHSGWSCIFNSDNFKKGCYVLSVRILRDNRKEYYELDGDKPICFVRS